LPLDHRIGFRAIRGGRQKTPPREARHLASIAGSAPERWLRLAIGRQTKEAALQDTNRDRVASGRPMCYDIIVPVGEF